MNKEHCGADKPAHKNRSDFWKKLRHQIGCGTNDVVLKSDKWTVKPKKGKP